MKEANCGTVFVTVTVSVVASPMIIPACHDPSARCHVRPNHVIPSNPRSTKNRSGGHVVVVKPFLNHGKLSEQHARVYQRLLSDVTPFTETH